MTILPLERSSALAEEVREEAHAVGAWDIPQVDELLLQAQIDEYLDPAVVRAQSEAAEVWALGSKQPGKLNTYFGAHFDLRTDIGAQSHDVFRAILGIVDVPLQEQRAVVAEIGGISLYGTGQFNRSGSMTTALYDAVLPGMQAGVDWG